MLIILQMRSKIKYISMLLSLITLVSSFQINPLQAGTFVFEDKILRLNTCITKTALLPFSEQYYSSHQDINVIAAITSLSINQHLNFYFHYQIKCSLSNCNLELNLGRYTEVVDPNFKYALTIDYLVAHGLKVANLNMTSFKATIKMGFLNQLETSPKYMDNDYNNDWQMILIPNGFSNVSLTGYITQTFITNSDIFVIKFKDESYGLKLHQSEIWPLNGQYILFTALFVPKQYLQVYKCRANNDCTTKVTEFVGFKWTKLNQINGILNQKDNNYAFQTTLNKQDYELLSLPFEDGSQFIDLRQHQSILTVEKQQLVDRAINPINYVYIVVVLLILQLLYVSFRKMRNQTKNGEGKTAVSTKPPLPESQQNKYSCFVPTQETEPSLQSEISQQQ